MIEMVPVGVGSSSLISPPELVFEILKRIISCIIHWSPFESLSVSLSDTTDAGSPLVFAFFGFFGSACERNRFAPHLRQCTFLEAISVQSLPPQNAQGPFIYFLCPTW
jgi:hypothetical protein